MCVAKVDLLPIALFSKRLLTGRNFLLPFVNRVNVILGECGRSVTPFSS